MTPLTASVFDLSDNLAPKADPRLIAGDERHFAAMATSIESLIADLQERLETARRTHAGRIGQEVMDRDDEIRRLTARLRTLRRYSLDLCLGHMVAGSETVYIGRLGLTGSDGNRLLLDWRSPAAAPFFQATHASPAGLSSRRRYRWTGGRITDYWDEAFTEAGFAGREASLDDDDAFLASLGGTRSARMRDVLGTIQADQDAITRAGSAGALVVDGGPGTGKTVVALHRTAYLLYSDPRLNQRHGGVLFVGPHEPYLAYVGDVLPSLGEDDVLTCTLRDLIPEGAAATPEPDPEVARLKSSAAMVDAIEAAVRFYEEPPAKAITVSTDESEIRVTAADWVRAFEAPEPGTPHNEARDAILDVLVEILLDKYEDENPESLRQNPDLGTALNRAWPMLEATDIVADLWSVPAYLRRCAPWLGADGVRKLQREATTAWTLPDLPLLDAARQRLGDSQASRRARQRAAAAETAREKMDRVVDDLIDAVDDDFGLGMVRMLRGDDFHKLLVDEAGLPGEGGTDRYAGPFAHVVVDEAQELTDAEWQMLLLRCPSRSFTIVGDRAQAREGFTESWVERLERVGIGKVALASLTINYRTPAEVMVAAEPVIRAALPDANVPTSIRSNGIPVRHAAISELAGIVETWLAADTEGTACVISRSGDASALADGRLLAESPRVRLLTPSLAKGLEFDLVVLVSPESFGAGTPGAVDRYVAMTRATRELIILDA